MMHLRVHRGRTRRLRFGLAALLAVAIPQLALAQSDSETHPVAEASRLRGARGFRAAIAVLREHLRAHPYDGDAIRMLAQTLYWSGEISEAEATYEAALAQHPEDSRLRLDYARMLVETRRGARARALLMPLRTDESAASEAEALLGTIAYWEGNLMGAKRHFEAALSHEPERADAIRQLRELRASAAPWVRLGGEARWDDQPLDRLAGTLEAGWYLTPLQSLAVRVQPQQLSAGDTTETVAAAEVMLAGYWPASRLETEAMLGVLQRSAAGTDWTGRLGVGLRLPQHLVLGARVERSAYLWTRASISTPVMTRAASGLLDWRGPRGWTGQAGYTLQQYPDENRIHTTFLWALAPVVRSAAGEVKLGYGFNYQDAEQSRFDSAPVSTLDPLFGRYEPYYTPQNLQAHSATGAARVQLGRAMTLRANGAYSVYATEDAPVLFRAGQGGPGSPVVQTAYYRRTIHPWNLRAALATTLPGGLVATAYGEHLRTAFYASTGAGMDLMYRFGRQ